MTDELVKELLEQQKLLLDKLGKDKRKDIWDRLSSLSGLFTLLSSLVIAGIGLFFTSAYQEQQTSIARVQTAEKFLPYLTGKNENAQKGAIFAMAALGDQELASRFAALIAGPGTIDALEIMHRTAEGDSKTTLKHSLIEAYFNRGKDLIDNTNRFDEAIRDYNQIRELATDNEVLERHNKDFLSYIYNNRGLAYHRKGDHDSAIKDYKKSLTVVPDNALHLRNLGDAYLAIGDSASSLINFNLAITNRPTEADNYTARGTLYLKQDKLEQAIKDFREAIERGADDFDAFYQVALDDAKKGDHSSAAGHFIRARNLMTDGTLPLGMEQELERIGKETGNPALPQQITRKMEKIESEAKPRQVEAGMKR